MKNIVHIMTACFVLMVPYSVQAEQVRSKPTVVLELFTSQGCSSCPPADTVLTEYDQRADVVALAYHVDYWDYIGWRDTFGDAAYSDRQRKYAAAQGKDRIYTPQLMINGIEDVVGSRPKDVAGAVARATLAIPVRIEPDDSMLAIDIGKATDMPESEVWLITYKSEAVVDVERGENRGRSLRYSQIVTDRQLLGMWEPDLGAHIKLPLDELLGETSNGLAILVQEDKGGLPGRILGAASYERSL